MNYIEYLNKILPNTVINESLSTVSPLYSVRFGDSAKSKKFDTFNGMADFVKEIKNTEVIHQINTCRDALHEMDVKKLREYNKEQNAVTFIRSGEQETFDVTFSIAGGSTHDVIKEHIMLYYPQTDDVVYTRALNRLMNKDKAIFYTGSSYTIRCKDMFYLNMVPFFNTPPISWVRLLVPIDGYTEAVEFMNKFEKGEL
jgi:hypothetical protein